MPRLRCKRFQTSRVVAAYVGNFASTMKKAYAHIEFYIIKKSNTAGFSHLILLQSNERNISSSRVEKDNTYVRPFNWPHAFEDKKIINYYWWHVPDSLFIIPKSWWREKFQESVYYGNCMKYAIVMAWWWWVLQNTKPAFCVCNRNFYQRAMTNIRKNCV